MTRRRTALLLLALSLCLAAVTAAAPPPTTEGPVLAELDQRARPLRTTAPYGELRDLRPLGRMVGDARVVGLGEATHNSHEFFTMKHRVLRYLVTEKGFRTFALEASWSTGRRLDAYLLTGRGDPRRIMAEEFQDTYLWWNNAEYLALIRWMRGYNVRHPHDPLRFMGDDFGYAGPELYDTVTRYVARTRPDLLPRFTALYRGLRPTTSAGATMRDYLKLPLADRKERAARTTRALRLLTRSATPAERRTERYAWTVQHATALDQTARGYAFDFDDPRQVAAAMRYRDRLMTDNVVWWQRRTGDKILLSAHDAHVAYETSDPANYPKMQGAFLRDRLGAGYLSIGQTFDRGAFNASAPSGETRVVRLGPARPGSNEHLLDRVRYRDFLVDLRTLPHAARSWLSTPRPTRSIGTAYPEPEHAVALARWHDLVVHVHRVRAAGLCTGACARR
ncbi:erythromycin esterase [Streptomyces sp. Ru73]|uniref:erythromycin esterase family protein n=1 Tax=Streptomyces sp. Ru73 TaxID=2080748 RepID=UPI000CDDFCF4|nr:erythromycin esterase family protein [Streptomyces sp. Ru73]POX36850.1 erythromycin esterase [Streptomyces sp. Ru73]